MTTSDKSRAILREVTILAFAFVCFSHIQVLRDILQINFASFTLIRWWLYKLIYFQKFFLRFFSSLGIIFLLTKKSSIKAFRVLLILIAISCLLFTIAHLSLGLYYYNGLFYSVIDVREIEKFWEYEPAFSYAFSLAFLSELLKTIMCIILVCMCFSHPKVLQYLQAGLGVLCCSDICLSLVVSAQDYIYFGNDYQLFILSLKYVIPISYFLLGLYLFMAPSVKISPPIQSPSTNTIIEQGEKKMKYCSHCGKEIMSEAVICPHCGCATGASMSLEPDNPSTGLNILSFFFPLIGLILFIVYHGKTPTKANAIGKWALIGFLVGSLLSVILYSMALASL